MSLPKVPDKLEEWNIKVIDSLIQILSIESETFDFKGSEFNKKSDELYNDICAMANTSGGYIVLGIREEKDPDGNIIRFIKEGFDKHEEDKVNQRVADNMHNIEPTPSIEPPRPIYEVDEKKFYSIIRINSINARKPYLTKNRGQCYVRIGNGSRPASRAVILNLLNNYIERKNCVERLRIAANFLKESLMSTSCDLENIDPASIRIMHLLDIDSLKNAIASTEWLLSENRLLGGHQGNNFNSQTIGVYYYLRELESLNLYLDIYNKKDDVEKKKEIKQYLCAEQFWCTGRQKMNEIIRFLDGISTVATEFIVKESR
jgi:hypothetical protein